MLAVSAYDGDGGKTDCDVGGTDEIMQGFWQSYVHNVITDPTGKGSIRSWRNGLQVAAWVGNLGDDKGDTFWKFGVYGEPQWGGDDSMVKPLAVQYANMEWGVTSLVDRVKNPIPVYP